MLRVMLGVCGAGLVTLGVFGEKLLDNTYQTVNGAFEPDPMTESVVVVTQEPGLPPNESSTAPDVVSNAESSLQDTMVVASVSKPEPPRILAIETEKLTEVKASARQVVQTVKTVATEPAAVEPVLPKEITTEQVVKTTTGPGPNNTLFVLKERVNLREGPSVNHSIVLQLAQGQELMEFKRDGKWVHVGAYGTSGKIGWVHGTLVSEN